MNGMKRLALYTASVLVMALSLLLPVSCIGNDEDFYAEFANTPRGNFTALWTIMDRHYCFFDLKKKELGVDWNQVYYKYNSSVSDKMSDRSLFEVLCSMIGELRDGHVNLVSAYDYGRNWQWKTDYPANFSKDLQDAYLGNDFIMASVDNCYKVLSDNIGYLAVKGFSSPMSSGQMNVLISNFALCNGMIIDLRDNGGGYVAAAEELASRFTEERILTGYSCYKNGPGHNDFSDLEENWLDPDMSNLRWTKPVVLLVNRGCFSSANDFANMMKNIPTVTLLGDTTGGGGGLPMVSELPNGWLVRFSSAPSFDPAMNCIESGVAPDIRLDMDENDIKNGVDTYIEYARKLINDRIINIKVK